jgi:hypothetical protein
MKIKTFTDIGFAKDSDRIERLDKMVNDWLEKHEDVDIISIQRNEYDNSYITVIYEE